MSEAARVPCVVCGGDEFAVRLDHRGRMLTSDRRVVEGVLVKEQCATCGALRSRPGTGPRDPLRYYAAEYEQNSTPEKYGYVTADGVVPRSAVEWAAVQRLRPPRPGERWLEVGCGAGDVLARLAAEAPRVEALGVELSERAAAEARARGLRVTPGDLDAASGRFDVVFAIGVIEHVADPRGFVRAAAARLRPGGALVLALPDLATPTFDVWFVDHLHHFAPTHVQRLCRDAGLPSFVDGERPAQTPHFMYLRADAGGGAPLPPWQPAVPPGIVQWQRGLDVVTAALRRQPRVGFLGASETAAFLLCYAAPPGLPRPLLFDDTCAAPTTRFGCEVRPGAELDARPCPVDLVIVATVPAYYPVLRASRLRHLSVPVVFPLDTVN